MLTKWGKKCSAAAQAFDASTHLLPTNFQTSDAAMIEAKTPDNSTVYIPYRPENPNFSFISSALILTGTSASIGVAVGSGSTAPTEDDYNLENKINGLTASATPSVVTYYDKSNWKACCRLDYALSNNTGEAVTISEIGLFRKFCTASTRGDSASTNARKTIMIDRTVLSQPITIPNGGAATVRYEFVYDA